MCMAIEVAELYHGGGHVTDESGWLSIPLTSMQASRARLSCVDRRCLSKSWHQSLQFSKHGAQSCPGRLGCHPRIGSSGHIVGASTVLSTFHGIPPKRSTLHVGFMKGASALFEEARGSEGLSTDDQARLVSPQPISSRTMSPTEHSELASHFVRAHAATNSLAATCKHMYGFEADDTRESVAHSRPKVPVRAKIGAWLRRAFTSSDRTAHAGGVSGQVVLDPNALHELTLEPGRCQDEPRLWCEYSFHPVSLPPDRGFRVRATFETQIPDGAKEGDHRYCGRSALCSIVLSSSTELAFCEDDIKDGLTGVKGRGATVFQGEQVYCTSALSPPPH